MVWARLLEMLKKLLMVRNLGDKGKKGTSKSQVATLKAVRKRRGRILAGASFSNHKNLLRLLSPVEVEKWARIRPKQVANKN